jgi:hypothetical protein
MIVVETLERSRTPRGLPSGPGSGSQHDDDRRHRIGYLGGSCPIIGPAEGPRPHGVTTSHLGLILVNASRET